MQTISQNAKLEALVLGICSTYGQKPNSFVVSELIKETEVPQRTFDFVASEAQVLRDLQRLISDTYITQQP